MSTTTVSVLPLTTPFEMTSCGYADEPYSDVDTSTSSLASGLSAFYTWTAIVGQNPGDCYPTGWDKVSYFSPGTCPDGFSMAYTSEVTAGTVTETHGTCCYDNYAIATDYPDLYPNNWWPCVKYPVQTTQYDDGNDWHYTVAGSLSVRWMSTDFVTTPTVATTTPPHATSMKSTSTGTPSKISGLSTGAKAGVGVGVSLGAILLIGAIVGAFFMGKRRNKAHEAYDTVSSAAPEPKDATSSTGTHELPVSTTYAPSATQSSVTHELHGSGVQSNTSSAGDVYELPTAPFPAPSR